MESQDCLTGAGIVFFFLREKVTPPHGSVSSNSQYFIELH